MNIFEKAMENIKPALEVKSRRVGGSNYQVPIEVSPARSQALAIRWLVKYARERGGKGMAENLASELIDASNGMKITSPADVAPIRGKEAFVYGTGTEEYFLFTDPECKYCKMLESYLPKIQDKVKIRVFYYPLDSHTNAKDLSLYIMSQKTADKKISAMFDSTTIIEKAKSMKYTPAELEKLEKQLDEQIQIGMKLNVQGTPTLFDKDGKNIIWVNLLEKFGIEVK